VKGKTDYIIACNDFKMDKTLENNWEVSDEVVLYSNDTGVNQLRVGGTGDALTGIISSYVSQGFTALQSMVVATNLFGFAGEQLARESYSFTARNLIKFYPKYIAKNG
jgi:NAD(P)H-hydrate epimerase